MKPKIHQMQTQINCKRSAEKDGGEPQWAKRMQFEHMQRCVGGMYVKKDVVEEGCTGRRMWLKREEAHGAASLSCSVCTRSVCGRATAANIWTLASIGGRITAHPKRTHNECVKQADAHGHDSHRGKLPGEAHSHPKAAYMDWGFS